MSQASGHPLNSLFKSTAFMGAVFMVWEEASSAGMKQAITC